MVHEKTFFRANSVFRLEIEK